ncbi:sulfotransferase domain-containing protein [Qipengyuania sp. 6B39]|uniref:sulfotransferase n=1 Tax=Qipengyuania proteolytica TaxID=2867239 RepID=UPI001C892AC7|nr:sulfotransferase domain-containing protein [Qipengyuania proteolytica]
MPFPDVFIIGAAKAGTSSLVDMLRLNGEVFVPHEKEPHHFTLRGGDPWTIRDGSLVMPLAATLPYGAERDYLTLYAKAREGQRRIDASTQYLVDPSAARAIRHANPHARIIACLRDPVSRAYSAYVHARSRGEEPCESFSAALDECEAGLRRNAFAINYVEESRYAKHLDVYRQLFGENVLILLFEDLIQKPQSLLDQVTDFLEIGRTMMIESDAAHKNPSIEISSPVARGFRQIAKRARRRFPALMNSRAIRAPYEALLAQIGKRPASLSAPDARRTYRLLASDIDAIEAMLDRELPAWHAYAEDAAG